MIGAITYELTAEEAGSVKDLPGDSCTEPSFIICRNAHQPIPRRSMTKSSRSLSPCPR